MTQTIPEPEWFSWATGEPPTTLDVWDGAPSLVLAPTRDGGAILWWQFDQGEDNSQYVLFAHLNSAEAQAVFEAHGVGPLDNIRATIMDSRIVIARRHPASGYERSLLIELPRYYDDDQFADWLDGIAEKLASEQLPRPKPAYDVFLGYRRPEPEKRNPTSIDRLAQLVVPA